MLTTDQCEELLNRYPAFRQHADEACLHVLHEAQFADIDAGTIVFHEASSARGFMWLIEGSVRVFKNSEEGREVTIYRVSPGELCVLTLNSLLGGGFYPASARSETPTKGLMISAPQFQHLMDRSRGFRNYVMQALIERLADTMSLISDITFRPLELRLACLLGQRFERSGGAPLDITHAKLASELGTTREVVSRILKEFERQDCIRLNRGQIHLVSPDGLEWFAQNRKETH